MAGAKQRKEPTHTIVSGPAKPSHALERSIAQVVAPILTFLVGVPFAGGALHMALEWGADVRKVAFAALLLAVLGAVVTWAVHQSTRSRDPWTRRRSSLSLGWIYLSWTVDAAIGLGGADGYWLITWPIVGLVLVAWWQHTKTEPYRGDGSGDGTGDGWAKSIGLAETSVPKVRENTPDKLVVEVDHPDDTHEKVQKALDPIASKAKSKVGGWRWEPVLSGGKALAHKSLLTYWRTDRLDKLPKWPGPQLPGDGCWEPITYGMCEDGEPAQLKLWPADGEDWPGIPSLLVVGTSGAAKTTWTRHILGELVTRQGLVIWGADPSKASQWVPYCRPAMDWFTTDPEEMRQQLLAMKRMVEVQMELLAEVGMDEWRPEAWTKHRIPALLYVMEESAPVQDLLETELVRGNEVFRSAGWRVVISLQRASESNMSTDLRNLITDVLCFRVQKQVDSTMALHEETVDAGAKPWMLRDPGMHYAELSREIETRWPMMRRTYDKNLPALVLAAAEYAGHPDLHPPLDPRLVEAAGPAFTGRQVVTRETWVGSRWGRIPLLKDPVVQHLLTRPQTATPQLAPAARAQVEAPVWGTPPAAVKEIPMSRPDDDDATDPETGEPADVDDQAERNDHQAVAMEADRVEEAVQAELEQDMGPDPIDEETKVTGSVEAALGALETAPAAGVSWAGGEREWVAAPSPEQRAVNFQVLLTEAFDEGGLKSWEVNDDGDRELHRLPVDVEAGPDGTRWVRVASEHLTDRWLDFPGELPGARPSLYRKLNQLKDKGWALGTRRGEWVISEQARTVSPPFTEDEADLDVEGTLSDPELQEA